MTILVKHVDDWESEIDASPDHLLVWLEAVQTRTAIELESAMPAELADVGLRRIRLLQLIPEGGTRQQDLARRAGISKQAMAEAIDSLQAEGLIERKADPADGRAWVVQRSRRGNALSSRFEAALAEVEERFAARLGKRRYAQLGQLLREVAEADPVQVRE